MSKSKSKSKSKQATFPDEYWRPDFEIYTYYPGLFEHGKELLAAPLRPPPEQGDVIARELAELLEKQRQLNDDFNKREQRRAEIEWEIDHLSRHYQTALLISPDSYPMTWQLMNTVSDLALIPVMSFKKKFARARPSQLEPMIEPMIEVPGHPAYPSGHSTQNFLIAHVLSEVIGDDAELIARVFAIARRVAENREWAGVHYHSDTEGGEELAREILPAMKRVFAEPIEQAIAEWQELTVEGPAKDAAPVQPAVAIHYLQEAPSAPWPGSPNDPLPGTRFREHQWNLQNIGQADAKPGVDINVLGAWDQLGIWRNAAPAKDRAVRVALIDLAIDFAHPALAQRFDFDGARNLDYPNLRKRAEEVGDERLRELGWTKEDVRERYLEAFGSFSSAHAIACAGIIAADAMRLKSPDGDTDKDEPGCLGIAPNCVIVPYRAMTLTEPVPHKRQALARGVLEATTGRGFVENPQPRRNGSAAHWKIDDKQQGHPAQVLLFPLPLEPLAAGMPDPLPLALAFAATRIPVIIPSGNKGTSSLSYPWESVRELEAPKSITELAELFDLDPASVRAIFGAVGSDQKPPDEVDAAIVDDLASLRNHGNAGIVWVGACNDRGRRSRYSQYGEGLTVAAPSDDVLPSAHERESGVRSPLSIATTDLQGIGGYIQDQSHYTLSDNEFGFGGTSAAAAQVAGVVALMLQANPGLRPSEVREILCQTGRVSDAKGNELLVADDGSAPGRLSPEFGCGLVDAEHAVKRAQQLAAS